MPKMQPLFDGAQCWREGAAVLRSSMAPAEKTPLPASGDGEGDALSGVVIGSYCHDVLFHGDVGPAAETLGGAASFVSNVLDAVSPSCCAITYIAKVGLDFAYHDSISAHPPLVSCSSPTTLFHAHFTGGDAERLLKRVSACDPIHPADLPPESDKAFTFGLAVAVAGEVPPETLDRMLRLCRVALVDVQGLIRSFDPVDGTVRLVPLQSTSFAQFLPRISFLKVSSQEAPFVDVDTVRRLCCVIVTHGKEGCRLFWDGGEAFVDPFPATQVDPTGAGDSFFAGFVAGLMWGLTVPDAAMIGNLFGSITVGHIGVPKLHPRMIQDVRRLLEQSVDERASSPMMTRDAAFDFEKSSFHGELRASLQDAVIKYCCHQHSPGTANLLSNFC